MKKLNLILFLTALIGAFAGYYFFSVQCFDDCSSNVIRGLLKPLFFGGIPTAVSLAILIPFSEKIFTWWLTRIAWWYCLVSIALISSIDVYAAGLFAVSRGQAALILFSVLICITIATILYRRNRD